jgi:hypothetical protein
MHTCHFNGRVSLRLLPIQEHSLLVGEGLGFMRWSIDTVFQCLWGIDTRWTHLVFSSDPPPGVLSVIIIRRLESTHCHISFPHVTLLKYKEILQRDALKGTVSRNPSMHVKLCKGQYQGSLNLRISSRSNIMEVLTRGPLKGAVSRKCEHEDLWKGQYYGSPNSRTS